MAIRLALVTVVSTAVIGCLPPRGADEREVLWPGGAPWARGTMRRDVPMLWIYRPRADVATDTAIVIASGGSYGHHGGLRHEAEPTARWLQAQGITAVVVGYRVSGCGRYDHRAFLADGARAIQIVRARASELGVAPDRIGMIGYSAGGHLAASLATRCASPEGPPPPSPIELPADALASVSCRPDFAAVVYPVVTLDPDAAHARSVRNLLGHRRRPSPALRDVLSVERQVTRDTAPIFVVHALDDPKVDPENSMRLHEGLVAHGVPTELHLYPDGGHGAGLAEGETGPAGMSRWPATFLRWARRLGKLGPSRDAPAPEPPARQPPSSSRR